MDPLWVYLTYLPAGTTTVLNSSPGGTPLLNSTPATYLILPGSVF